MSPTTLKSERHAAAATLRDRCAQLGVPVWRFDASMHRLMPPAEGGVLGAWSRSRVIERLVDQQARRWLGEESPEVALAFPGCWLLPHVEKQRKRRLGVSVAIALGAEALESEQFLAVCQAAELDAGAARHALRTVAVFNESTVQRLASMLGWAWSDLMMIEQRQTELGGFSRQLGESYEEISLLYKLGQSMTELENPHRFIRLACDELHVVLPFAWIAARFGHSASDAVPVSNMTFVSGELPCAVGEFERVADRLMIETPLETRLVSNHHEKGRIGSEQSQMLMHPIFCEGQRVGALFAGDKRGDDREVTSIDMKMLDAAVSHMAVMLQNARLYEARQRMFLGTLEALTASIDAKDPYTCGHSERVAHVAVMLARELGQGETAVERVRIAGLVHDIGKIGVPESVLCKPGKLTDEEFAQIKLHPEIGHHILRDIPLLDDVLPGVMHHHERYDGRGYPHGLVGEAIPMIARIIGLADAFDAMSSNRTYRPAMPRERVLEEIARGAGKQFDPALAAMFPRLDFTAYDAMVARHHALAEHGADRFGRGRMAA
jgi:putative nucleotidyltransferase with HDIG domain